MSILIGAKRDRFEVKISVTASIIINITKDEQYCFEKLKLLSTCRVIRCWCLIYNTAKKNEKIILLLYLIFSSKTLVYVSDDVNMSVSSSIVMLAFRKYLLGTNFTKIAMVMKIHFFT